MKLEIKVPAMGESITEATVGSILKPSGSVVAMDDEVLELETDKVNQVLFAPQGGVLSLTVKPEDVVKIGQVIGFIDHDHEQTAAPKKEVAAQPAKAVEPAKTAETPKTAPKSAPKTPAEPTSGARLSKEDFVAETAVSEKAAAAVPAPAPAKRAASVASQPAPVAPGQRETRKKMTKIRKVIAQRLVESQQNTAMLTTFNEIDMTEVIALREKYKESFAKEHGTRLGFMSFFVKGAVSALKEFPDLNSYIDGEEIVHREYYDIGIAVGTDRGLVVPVLRNCDVLTFAGIESAIANFAAKAREGTLTVDDLQGGGFTITNGGTYGSLLSTPILNYPQSGILGMHMIQKRPVAINDAVVIRPMMYVALSYDHRIVDGKGAVSFLVHLKNCLEDPARLLLDL